MTRPINGHLQKQCCFIEEGNLIQLACSKIRVPNQPNILAANVYRRHNNILSV